jgi:hypothetical protein
VNIPNLAGTPWRAIILSEKHEAWALVDAIDYPWLIQHKWNLSWGRSCPWKLYAKRNVGKERATVRMHRAILQVDDPLPIDEAIEMHGDHANGQGLDNRRANLRWATPIENRANTRRREQIPSLELIVMQLLHQVRPARQAMAAIEATF